MEICLLFLLLVIYFLLSFLVAIYIYIYIYIHTHTHTHTHTHSKKCWVKYNPALGKIWTNPVIGLYLTQHFLECVYIYIYILH